MVEFGHFSVALRQISLYLLEHLHCLIQLLLFLPDKLRLRRYLILEIELDTVNSLNLESHLLHRMQMLLIAETQHLDLLLKFDLHPVCLFMHLVGISPASLHFTEFVFHSTFVFNNLEHSLPLGVNFALQILK